MFDRSISALAHTTLAMAFVAVHLTELASAQGSAVLASDGFGNIATAIAEDFVDIRATGTDLGLTGGDDAGAILALPIPFEFYGDPQTSLGVSTNGYLTFGNEVTEFSNQCAIPDPELPNSGVYPFWDDLVVPATGAVHVQTLGAAPDRVLVVQWSGLTFFLEQASLTFQAKLFESSNAIEFHYETLGDAGSGLATGASATIGMEAALESAEALSISCNMPAVSGGSAFRIELAPAPFLSGPALVGIDEVLEISLRADPGAVFCVLVGTDQGPLEFPGLPSFDVGPDLDSVLVVKSGLAPPDGLVDILVPVPNNPALECQDFYFQSLTVDDLGTIETSSNILVGVQRRQDVTGSLDAPGTADYWQFDGNAGDLVTIELCRTANEPGGTGSLDPFLCLLGEGMTLLGSSDDEGGECEVDGPFGSSIIEEFELPADGTFFLGATAFQGMGDETGTYRLTLTGCVGDLTLNQAGGVSCFFLTTALLNDGKGHSPKHP